MIDDDYICKVFSIVTANYLAFHHSFSTLWMLLWILIFLMIGSEQFHTLIISKHADHRLWCEHHLQPTVSAAVVSLVRNNIEWTLLSELHVIAFQRRRMKFINKIIFCRIRQCLHLVPPGAAQAETAWRSQYEQYLNKKREINERTG